MIIEDLPPELWLEFFSYLNIQDRFKGFFNLNTRINKFLLNYHYYLSLQSNDENSQYLLDYILPQLPHPEYISSLRLDKIASFKNTSLLHFPCLSSLTLCRLFITNDILDLLKYHASNLKYLNISLFVSNKWNILLPLVLSLPKLKICYLHLGIGLCPIKSSILSASPIECLSLIGPRQPCCRTKLMSLLNHLPHLKSLHIECDKLNCNESIPSINQSLSLSLKLNHLPYFFVDFIDFISTTMPYIEKLKLECCNPLIDLVYINVYQWIRLINLLPNLKELILIITPEKTIKIEAWNRRCEQLIKFLNIRRIIQSIEHKN